MKETREILRVNMSNFRPVYKNKDGKLLTDKELDSIDKLNEGFVSDDEHEKIIEVIEEFEESWTESVMVNMGYYWMVISRDASDEFTNVEFSNNMLTAYKVKESVEDVVKQFNVK